MKAYKIIKSVLFILAGIAIIAFYDFFAKYPGYSVAGTMVFFIIDKIATILSFRSKRHAIHHFLDVFCLVILAIILFAFELQDDSNFIQIVMLWAIWSIMREIDELKEVVHLAREGHPFFLNAIESIFVIIISIVFVFKPYEKLNVHIVILGVELILQILFPQLDLIYERVAIKHPNNPVTKLFKAIQNNLTYGNKEE